MFFQVWKRSGAWFFKGIPKYTIPEKKMTTSKYTGNRMGQEMRGSLKNRPGSTRRYNTWSTGRPNQGIIIVRKFRTVQASYFYTHI